MFSYMKGLAYTDLVYLLMTIQVCIFTILVSIFEVISKIQIKLKYIAQLIIFI